MSGRLFTDKLVFRWSEVLGGWSLDSATPATPGYPGHANGSLRACLKPWINGFAFQGKDGEDTFVNFPQRSFLDESLN